MEEDPDRAVVGSEFSIKPIHCGCIRLLQEVCGLADPLEVCPDLSVYRMPYSFAADWISVAVASGASRGCAKEA